MENNAQQNCKMYQKTTYAKTRKPLLNICGSNKCFSRTNFDGGCCAPRVSTRIVESSYIRRNEYVRTFHTHFRPQCDKILGSKAELFWPLVFGQQNER